MAFLSDILYGIAHPIQAIKGIVSGVAKGAAGKTYQTTAATSAEFGKQPVASQVVQAGLTLGAVAATAAGVGAAATAAKAGTLAPKALSVAKSLIPVTTKGKIIAAVAAPVAIGAFAKEPIKTAQLITKAPSELGQFGGDIASFAANPSLESAKQIIKESPVLSAAAAVTGVAAVGSGVSSAVSNYLTRKEMKEQTEIFSEQLETMQQTTKTPMPEFSTLPYSTGYSLPTEKTLQTDEGTPITAETTTISTGKRKRRARLKEKPSVRQSVRLNIVQSSRAIGQQISNKRYINAYA